LYISCHHWQPEITNVETIHILLLCAKTDDHDSMTPSTESFQLFSLANISDGEANLTILYSIYRQHMFNFASLTDMPTLIASVSAVNVFFGHDHLIKLPRLLSTLSRRIGVVHHGVGNDNSPAFHQFPCGYGRVKTLT
jgi:hypothetical protein